MSVELLEEDAPDAEEFVIAWLEALTDTGGRVAVEREAGAELPFWIVTRVAGPDDPDCFADWPVVDVDLLVDNTSGDQHVAAKDEAKRTHRRMLYLAQHVPDVTMADGSLANCDWVKSLQRPVRMPYSDKNVIRYVARYELGLSFVAV